MTRKILGFTGFFTVPKPRVRVVDHGPHETYLCVGGGTYGYGATPTKAYDQWLAKFYYRREQS